MQDFLLFALLGLGAGALIAGLALAIVLVYRGCGVINLATGAIAMVGAYLFLGLHDGRLLLPALPVGAALPLALAGSALAGALIDGVIFRQLRGASPLAKLVATLGLLLSLQAVAILVFGSNAQAVTAVLPHSTVRIFDVPVPVDRFILLAIVVVVTAGLAIVYRFSRFGVATRAAQENEEAAMLTGLSPDRLSMTNTVLASLLAGGLGILVAPISQLDPSILTFTVIPALAAALIAGFTSFAVASAAGIAMGMVSSLVIWLETMSWFPTAAGGPLPGVADLIFLLVIVLVLFARGGALPERGAIRERRLPRVPRGESFIGVAACMAVAAILVVVVPFDLRQALINSLIGAMVCLSYVVLTGYLGQISLLQVSLAGVAGLLISKLSMDTGIGFPFAPMLGILGSLVVGVALGASALRVRGVSLAIVTMAAAVAVQSFWFENPEIGIEAATAKVPEPSFLGIDLGTHAGFFIGSNDPPSPVFGLVCVGALAVAAFAVIAIRRSELGRRMLAVRSNERAASAAGVSVRETKLLAYAIASVLAGLAGSLYAYDFGTISAPRYALAVALSLIAFAYLGGITSVFGALTGGLLVTQGVLTYLGTEVLGIPIAYQLILGGVALIVIVIRQPEGIAGALVRRREVSTQ